MTALLVRLDGSIERKDVNDEYWHGELKPSRLEWRPEPMPVSFADDVIHYSRIGSLFDGTPILNDTRVKRTVAQVRVEQALSRRYDAEAATLEAERALIELLKERYDLAFCRLVDQTTQTRHDYGTNQDNWQYDQRWIVPA